MLRLKKDVLRYLKGKELDEYLTAFFDFVALIQRDVIEIRLLIGQNLSKAGLFLSFL